VADAPSGKVTESRRSDDAAEGTGRTLARGVDMEFRVLGPLEAWRDGRQLRLGSFKQRSLLAVLLINANHTVSADRIIDELWGDEAATDRQNALWVQVSKLRSALEPDRERRSDGTVLLTRLPGYVLAVEDSGTDVWRFEQAMREGRSLLESDPAAASLVLGEGLAVWRGRPYEDFLYESFAQAEVARLEELRLEAVELRVEADLRRGLAAELVGELQGLVHQHPLREQLTAQLMLALYRADRQAEALRAYAALRSRLGEELGLDPSSALQRLDAQIVSSDPDLDLRASAASPIGRLAIRGYELREPIGTTAHGTTYRAYQPAVGREVALTVIGPELANDVTFIRRFQSEAEMVAGLEHPHVVPLYDFWREPDGAYLVTRLFREGTLEEARRAGPLAADAAATIVADVASALAPAHRRGVVHGRIGPATIFVEDGRGFLGGFGVPSFGNDAAIDVFSLGQLLAWASDELPAAMTAVVERATATHPADRFADAAAFAEALGAATDVTASSEDGLMSGELVNPYKGLHAFGEADAGDFFGRERLVERLLTRLGSSGVAGRFVAVVGPSGSGKSSVVRAGVLPAVRSGAITGSTEWFVVQVAPGRHPFDELAGALRAIAVSAPADLREQLTTDAAGLSRVVRAVLPDERSQLLLVIDQFEEIFTLADAATCRRFLDALVRAVEDRRTRVRVVITLRADFYDRPLRHHDLGELLRRGTEPITVMSPDELRQAIEGPAARIGVRYEPGLVAQIVADVADHPAALPLLQYTLTLLFDQRDGGTIRLDSYRELGGAAGALVRRAESVYRALEPAAREATRQVMLRLVNVGDGDNDNVTRRRVLSQELVGLGDEQVPVILDTLARHRLVAFDRDAATRSPTVEIAHEALFAEWDRLRGWISDCRQDVRRHRRLVQAAEEWRSERRASDFLLRGSRLDELALFAESGAMALTPSEREFLDASLTERDAERRREREQQDREARLRRAGRRRTWLLRVSAAMLVVVTVVAAVAVSRQSGADRDDAARTEARRLAGLAADVSNDDPELAMLMALQSLATSAGADLPALPEAEEALQWGINEAGVTYPVADVGVDLRHGPDGPTGFYQLALGDVVELARVNLSRGFTPDECVRYGLDPCPSTGGLASPAATGPAAVPSSPPPVSERRRSNPLAGTTVTVLDGGSLSGLDAEFDEFEKETGIDVVFAKQGSRFNRYALPDGRRPDVAVAWNPGAVNELGRAGRLIDLGAYLDRSALRDTIGDRLVNAASVDSGVFWLPLYLNLKGVVWYRADEFEAAGYRAPRTWNELIALNERMVADGRTPWCLGSDSERWAGHGLTDWLEALVLRVGGVELYDRWTAHEVPFDHPDVRRAGELLTQTLGDERFVTPELRDAAFARDFTVSPLDAGCLMWPGLQVLPAENLDYFMLPSLETGAKAPVLVEGPVAIAFSDRPEVRALMRHIASKQWGLIGGTITGEYVIPARADVGGSSCYEHDASADTNVLRVRLCGEVRDAIANDSWRYDASDLMPGPIGELNDDETPGVFYEGMTDYAEQNGAGLDEILAEIEAAWQEP
jgi:DNA-binding SARP family transcriptional activator/ABC-type glycerol-3-phosphate transport system substrate-binding protein